MEGLTMEFLVECRFGDFRLGKVELFNCGLMDHTSKIMEDSGVENNIDYDSSIQKVSERKILVNSTEIIFEIFR